MRARILAPIAVLIAVGCWLAAPARAQDIGDPELSVLFEYSAPSAKAVYLAGQFNNWLDNESGKIKEKPEWLMKKDDNGNWKITIKLKPGNHQYKFVVDGEWKTDPTNPEKADDGHGGHNSVKIVSK
jgi:1,4-alpha-glucan branching enzyme